MQPMPPQKMNIPCGGVRGVGTRLSRDVLATGQPGSAGLRHGRQACSGGGGSSGRSNAFLAATSDSATPARKFILSKCKGGRQV